MVHMSLRNKKDSAGSADDEGPLVTTHSHANDEKMGTCKNHKLCIVNRVYCRGQLNVIDGMTLKRRIPIETVPELQIVKWKICSGHREFLR